ncbi:MAG: uridine kinase [Verrucomicrobia bacterium]|nr:MAG: uridine kinase [Verrucomicrobiota bacterium]
MHQFDRVISEILARRADASAKRAVLVGISGIDASGKGFITEKIAKRLQESGSRVAMINADDWLNLPEVCLSRHNPAEHFYEHAMRLDEMFNRLIVPLKEKRSISLLAECADAKTTVYRKHLYEFRNIDIVLVEGIFLFKPSYRDHFDVKIWIDCSFATALKRASMRCQEGLPPAETVRAFTEIYFPAQGLHFARDNPRASADAVLSNDPSM